MTEPRVASHVQVAALRRAAEAAGAFAMLLRKGDPTSGSLLLIRREKGMNPALFERFPNISGATNWSEKTIQDTDKERYLTEYLARRVENDPDVWIIELDVPFEERFTDIIGVID